MRDHPMDYQLGVSLEELNADDLALGKREPCARRRPVSRRGARPCAAIAAPRPTRRIVLEAVAMLVNIVAWGLVVHLVAPPR